MELEIYLRWTGKMRSPDVNLLSEFDQLFNPLSPSFTPTFIITRNWTRKLAGSFSK